jgi:hypothetical protein
MATILLVDGPCKGKSVELSAAPIGVLHMPNPEAKGTHCEYAVRDGEGHYVRTVPSGDLR